MKSSIKKIMLSGCVLALLYSTALRAVADEKQFHRFWPDNLFAVEFFNEKIGFVAGQAGTVLRTINAGESWEAFFIGKPELIRRFSFVSETEGWAVGHRGSIFHTANSGATWETQHSSEGIYLRDIQFFDRKHGWAVGHGAEILYTQDGGLSWAKQHLTGYKGRDLPRLHGVEVIDERTAILVGEFGVIAHTEDAGEHWIITPVDTKVTWLSLALSQDCIYVVGLDGNAACLTVASEQQREEIDKNLAQRYAKEQEKARKKAARRGQKYSAPLKDDIPRSAVEYVVTPITTGSTEHLFDVVKLSDGGALTVGRSTVVRLRQGKGMPLEATEGLPIDYLWFGGVGFSSTDQFWAVGIQGLVIKGDVSQMSYSAALSLPKSENIKLVSSRWVKENGR